MSEETVKSRILSLKAYYELVADVTSGTERVSLRFAPREEERMFDRAVADTLSERAKGFTGPLQVTHERMKWCRKSGEPREHLCKMSTGGPFQTSRFRINLNADPENLLQQSPEQNM